MHCLIIKYDCNLGLNNDEDKSSDSASSANAMNGFFQVIPNLRGASASRIYTRQKLLWSRNNSYSAACEVIMQYQLKTLDGF